MRKTIYYIAALIGLYLVLVHWGGFSQDLQHAFKGGIGTIQALQGN